MKGCVFMLKGVKRVITLAFILVTAMGLLSPGQLFTKTVFAANTIPDLTITEILANSSGDSAAVTQCYEYVELKNNTSRTIDLSGYKIIFWWTPTQYVTWDMTTSQSVPAGGVVVVWIKSSYAQGYTLSKFKAHYGLSAMPDSNFYVLDLGPNGGLGNTGTKKMILATDAGKEVCIAKYNDQVYNSTTTNIDAVVENSSIVYEFPEYLVDGNITMKKVACNQKPTPTELPTYPSLWITELLPNPSVSSTDAGDVYEYVELYNNTGSPVNLSAYKLRYFWDPANPSGFTDYDLSTSANINPYGYMVLWLRDTNGQAKTLANFNEHYNTFLTSSQVYDVNSKATTGLIGNAGKRTVKLLRDSDNVIICSATYNDGTSDDAGTRVDTTQDTSIIYGYPVDNTTNMRKIANTQYPTPGEGYNWFGGQLHSHTGYSDGKSTPAVAYSTAKTNRADFFAVTDHAEQFDNPDNWAASTEWADLRTQAGKATVPYRYSGIAGWEISPTVPTGWWGHSNVFNTEWFYTRDQLNKSLYELFDQLAKVPEAVFQFNHPGYYWGDAQDFKYYNQAADDQACLIEQINSTHDLDRYIRALDQGWHVAPIWNGDNHTTNWMADTNRGIVLAEYNTPESIMEAIRARRVYCSYGDADLKVAFKINGQSMGSRLSNPGTLNVSITAANPTDDKISKITLYGEGGKQIASQTYNSRMAEYTTSIPPQYKYYFAVIEQVDGDYAVTAPIWITDNPGMQLTLRLESTTASAPARVIANITNTSGTALSNVSVAFYKDDMRVHTDNYSSANLLETKTVSSIAAGNTNSTAYTDKCPNNGSNIMVQVTATVGGVTKSVLKNIYIPGLYITEIVANSKGNTGEEDWNGYYIDEDYDFVEIFNNTKSTINLKNYALNKTYMDVITIPSDFNIPAKTVKVVWIKKKGSTKTLADFNAIYGTSFTSGQVLEVQSNVEGSGLGYVETRWVDIIPASDANLTQGEYQRTPKVARGKYNDGLDLQEVSGDPALRGADPAVDGKAKKYSYPVDGSFNMYKFSGVVTPTPGTVSSDQYIP